MKTIKITVEVSNNDEYNTSTLNQATYDNTPLGVAYAMSLLTNAIEEANREEEIVFCAEA